MYLQLKFDEEQNDYLHQSLVSSMSWFEINKLLIEKTELTHLL